MKDIPLHKGKTYIHDLVAQGEHGQQDFKLTISDPRKIARSISAFANTEGGHLLIGVKDNGVIAGVRNEEDIYVVEQAAQSYCVPAQEVEFTAYSTSGGSSAGCIVIKASVSKASERPVCVKEERGALRAYWRVRDENIAAHPIMVRGWRLRSSPSGTHLSASGADTLLLQSIAREGEVSVEQALRLTAASERSVSAALARLFSLGLIEFVHKGSAFYVVAAE